MPTIDLARFKYRRQQSTDYHYDSNVRPQMQYLAANLNEMAKNLRKANQRDSRISKLQNIADALNGLAGAGMFTRDSTAEKYLQTMSGLPELLE